MHATGHRPPYRIPTLPPLLQCLRPANRGQWRRRNDRRLPDGRGCRSGPA